MEGRTKPCTCSVCLYANEVDINLGKISDNDSVKFFKDMYLRLCGAEMDNAVNRAMLRDEWPSGRLIYVPKNCNNRPT